MAFAWRSSSASLVLRPSRQLTTLASASLEIQQRRVDRLSAPLPARHSPQEASFRAKLESPDRHRDASHERPGKVAEAREHGRTNDRQSLLTEYVPDDVIKEFEAKLQGDLQSVFATLFAGIGVITWWRGVWALLDHYVGDSVFGHWMCVITGLMIILYIRFSGAKLTNFFPPS